MYNYLDRAVTSLDNDGRFLLWAMRAWRHSRTRRLCPADTLRPAFDAMRAGRALTPFHAVLGALDAAGALRPGALPDRRIGEDEAVLLALFRDGLDGKAGPVLARLLPARAAAHVAAQLLLAAGHLAEAAGGGPACPLCRRVRGCA